MITLRKVELGGDALAFVRSQLAQSGYLGRVIPLYVDLSLGRLWTMLPDEGLLQDPENLDYEDEIFSPEFVSSPRGSFNFNDPLIDAVQAFLGKDGGRISVFEGDCTPVEILRREGRDTGYVDEYVDANRAGWIMHYLLPPAPPAYEIRRVVRAATSYYSIAVLSENLDPEHRRSITEDRRIDLPAIVAGLRMLIVGSFDLQSYIFWEPDAASAPRRYSLPLTPYEGPAIPDTHMAHDPTPHRRD